MKTKTCIALILSCLMLSACGPTIYNEAPPQNLELATGETTTITVANRTGGNVEFFEGPMKGLILAPMEAYIVKLPRGLSRHSWSQVVMHKERVIDYSDEIIVTHESRTLLVVPPPRDDLFYTRGYGSLLLRNF